MKKHASYQVKHRTTNYKKYRKLSKTAAVVGSTVTAVSVAAPLIPTVNVQADTVQYSNASSQQQFINQIAPHAQSVANANDLYASVMMAQAILESAWGKSTLAQAPNYNLFGIKGSYNGQTVYMNTLEFLNGQWVTKNEPFRRYPSFAESFMDNARTLRNVSFQSGVYYYAGAWKSNTTSYRDATAWLTGRYATDPNYATSLNRIIETYGLTQYDTPSSGNPSHSFGDGTNTNLPSNGNQEATHTGTSTYTIVAGDSLYAIAKKFGVTIAQLKSWNQLSSDMIYVGQKLSIQTGTGNTTVMPNPSTPTAPSTPSSSTDLKTQTYTVVSGDSVWKIANQFGISMEALRSQNHIQNNFIYPGQVLKIPLVSNSEGSTTPITPTVPNHATSNTPSQTPTVSTDTYTVKSGDSLWLIANRYGLSVSQLKSMNQLTSDLIYPGQKLAVRKGSHSVINQEPNPTNTTNLSEKNYTVVAGDSVWKIANKFGISMNTLRNLNHIKNDFIYPGQVLKVQASTTPSTAVSQSTTTTSKATTYRVKSGDSLWSIAQKHGLSVAQLKALNQLTSDLILVNQTLKVK